MRDGWEGVADFVATLRRQQSFFASLTPEEKEILGERWREADDAGKDAMTVELFKQIYPSQKVDK